PTVHEHFKVESLKFKVNNAEHFGMSMAILAGDLAMAWADECMGEVNGNALELYHRMKEEVIFGQGLDVLASAGLPSADRATINRYKTAWYSVIRPLQIGAAIGGADEKTLETFVPYGLAVGEAYQLRDDFLDSVLGEDVFQEQATRCGKEAVQAVKKLKVSKSVTILLTDFVRFALHRSA
ncbi:polyprenyl synthetase family protein, partial [Candidatus Gottesmanbacteria bacterium]|nr:polyprenyl synthetase family protein [Candidatus Gottesmanbacteria bacterium]